MTRGEAKADAKAAKARAKAMRPWYRKKRFWLLGAAVLLVVIVAASGGGDDGEPSPAVDTRTEDDGITGDRDEADDVTITRCDVGEFGMAGLALEVVNDSSKRSTYTISITIEDPDGVQIGEAFDIINNVDPGQKAVSEPAASITGEPASITCHLTDVDRIASD